MDQIKGTKCMAEHPLNEKRFSIKFKAIVCNSHYVIVIIILIILTIIIIVVVVGDTQKYNGNKNERPLLCEI